MKKKIRVLVVDDSAVMRQLLSEILASDPQIEVVGTAPDPYAAREKIKSLNPDVLTLDVEMPRMDGIAFLRNLMRLRPMPVVMCSSLTQQGADVALDALALGAVDFVAKPADAASAHMDKIADDLIDKIKVAARADFVPRPRLLVEPARVATKPAHRPPRLPRARDGKARAAGREASDSRSQASPRPLRRRRSVLFALLAFALLTMIGVVVEAAMAVVGGSGHAGWYFDRNCDRHHGNHHSHCHPDAKCSVKGCTARLVWSD